MTLVLSSRVSGNISRIGRMSTDISTGTAPARSTLANSPTLSDNLDTIFRLRYSTLSNVNTVSSSFAFIPLFESNRLLSYPAGVDVHKATDVASASVGGFAPSEGQQGISFDRFVRACVVIKQLTEAFQRLDTDRDGWIQIQYETFMQTVLSLP